MHSGNVFYRGELNRVYPIMERGEGVYIYDSEGNKYLDAMSGIAVVNLGYGTPEVVDAMAEQAKKLPFCFTVRFTTLICPPFTLSVAQADQIVEILKQVFGEVQRSVRLA